MRPWSKKLRAAKKAIWQLSNYMVDQKKNDPLHGITLEQVVTKLVAHYGWPELGKIIRINCFNFDPSITSSLRFLRKTPWARKQVEELYVIAFC